MKLELLTNATVDDAIMFVCEKAVAAGSNPETKTAAHVIIEEEKHQLQQEENNKRKIESDSSTTVNQVF